VEPGTSPRTSSSVPDGEGLVLHAQGQVQFDETPSSPTAEHDDDGLSNAAAEGRELIHAQATLYVGAFMAIAVLHDASESEAALLPRAV
jgi:hypothetical protein